MLFFEIIVLFPHVDSVKTLSLAGNYDSTLFAAAILSLIGQLVLIVGAGRDNRLLKLSALVILWLGFIYLVHNIIESDSIAGLSFVTGLPFLIISLILFVRLCRPNMGVVYEDEITEE
jgi:hypothetical protein